ncbi:MAG: N-acetylmuramoyl-L-alanine amidase, partial [Okeania sp. SIO2D1]|nr:N-acetylmuramoyl-L-alanine amidase [Okeania sp. SIO2D1]
MGHNAPPDTGARGIAFEDRLTKDVGNRVISKLGSLGHSAVNCTPSRAYSVIDSLRRRVRTGNAQNLDYYVSIHFNAFNGRANGTEVFAISNTGRRIAQPVLDNIVSLGFVNRRVKNGSHLYVLRHTNMPAILIECCFLDSRRDMDLFNSEDMANAIVKGLTGQTPPGAATARFNVPQEEATLGEISTGVTLAAFQAVPEQEELDNTTLELQKALNTLKITGSEDQVLPEDGILDSNTKAAISKFNEIVDLGDFGAAGVATWNALAEILEKPILRVNHADGC